MNAASAKTDDPRFSSSSPGQFSMAPSELEEFNSRGYIGPFDAVEMES